MTEKKAIEIAIHCIGVQAEQEVCEECLVYHESGIVCKEVANMAIKALKEIQQYREIGTVEECKKVIGRNISKIPDFQHMLGERTAKYKCSVCGHSFVKDCMDTESFFCPNCGQLFRMMPETDE